MTANRGDRGFSAAELMVVIAVLGILAAVGIPNFRAWMPTLRLNGAARQVMGDLMAARMQAVKESNEFKVFFLNSHQYEILDDEDDDGTIDAGEATTPKDIREEFRDVTINSTANPVFYPRGTAYPATITLSNSAGTRKVKVHLTGRVKIE